VKRLVFHIEHPTDEGRVDRVEIDQSQTLRVIEGRWGAFIPVAKVVTVEIEDDDAMPSDALAQLLALLEPLDDVQRDLIRGAGAYASLALLERMCERVGRGDHPDDPTVYVLGAFQREGLL
jgi:hypothetical protein